MSSLISSAIFLMYFVAVVYSEKIKRSVLNQEVNFPSDTIDVIDFHGYNGETHTILTSDGYYLKVHRITGKKNTKNNIKQNKPVVLLMHGLLCSSSSWILTGPEKGLGYILSDAGYDVWMGNFRGNIYSKKHKNYNTSSAHFWNFSWHEMGKFDLPSMIIHIKKRTGVKKIFYIGHSQGTTAYFVMSSIYPTFVEKSVVTAVALAPVAYLHNIKSVGFKLLSNFIQTFVTGIVQTAMSLHNVDDSYGILKKVLDYLCDKSEKVSPMCENLLFVLGGYDDAQMNKTLLPIIWKHVPAGSSMKQLIHYTQLINTERFQMYDGGSLYNLYHYKTLSPPEYNLEKCNVPVALYYSGNDWLSTPHDVKTLYYKLPVAKRYWITYKNFTHIDFMWANDVKTLLYDHVLLYLKPFLRIL